MKKFKDEDYRLFDSADSNKDAQLTLEEWTTKLQELKLHHYGPDFTQAEFEDLDIYGLGSLQFEEFKVLRERQRQQKKAFKDLLDPKQELFDWYDSSKDNMISREEYLLASKMIYPDAQDTELTTLFDIPSDYAEKQGFLNFAEFQVLLNI